MWFPLQVALASPVPPPAAEAVACPANTWVATGKLLVRSGPEDSAEIVGDLARGAPARRVLCVGDWARIEAAGSADGWVARADLALDPVEQTTDALERPDELDRRVWVARFAASRPTVERARAVHRDLLDGGHFAAADDLARAMGWPVIALVSELDGKWVVAREVLEWRPDLAEGELSPAARAAVGVVDGETWWVLGAEGGPVRATVGSVRVVHVVEVLVVAELVLDAPVAAPLVAARGAAPPASWLVDAGADQRPSVERAVQVAVAAAGKPAVSTRTWAAGDSRGVRVFHDQGRTTSGPGLEEPVPVLEFVDFRVAPDGSAHLLGEGGDELFPAELPRLARDLDGDGRADTVWSACSERVDGADGALLAIAPNACGC